MPNNVNHSVPIRALLLGVLTGARSATPLAMLALHHDRPALRGAWQGWPVFRSPVGRGVLMLAGVGELVGDKLPRTPSRVGAGGLGGRIVSGAIAGLAISTVGGDGTGRRVTGALLGAAGAVIGSYAGYLGRRAVVSATGLPDPVIALVEDAVTISGSAAVVRAS